MTKHVVMLLMTGALYGATAAASPDVKNVLTGTGIGERVPQFTASLLTVSGDKPQTTEFDSRQTTRTTAYVFVGVTCPATNAYTDRFKQLEQTYGAKDVDFIYIYPNSNDTAEAKRAFHKEHQFKGRMIDDQGAKLATQFKAQRTSEVFLTDKNGVVLYHGAVDDARDPAAVKQRYLAMALDEHLAGKPITTAQSEVFA